MIRREIVCQDRFEAILAKRRALVCRLSGVDGGGTSFGDQFVLRIEMPVEPAVGQTGRCHHIIDAGAINSFSAKLRCGRLDDATPCLCSFDLRLLHSILPF